MLYNKKHYLMTLWSVWRIEMLDASLVEQPLIHGSINTLCTCVFKVQWKDHSQHRAKFRYEEPAGHLSLLKMTQWNACAVVWIGWVGQIVLPEALSQEWNVCTCILLHHSGIGRTLYYCWGPVSSFKECVWLSIRDISSCHGRSRPKWDSRSEWELLYSP